MPEFKVDENLATVPGTDGAKMSKSYGNTVDLFTTEKKLKKQLGTIVTDGSSLEEPKEYENCNVYKMCQLFMSEDELLDLRERYKRGGEGHGHFKMTLKDKIWDHFEEARSKKAYYDEHLDEVRDILNDGAKKAKIIASSKMEIIREKVGII
jgi:tryptophanyl-tRNA synthetase